MKESKKYLSLPIEKFTIEDIDEDLARVEIYVMHDGKNLKKSNFSKACMEDAQETIKNKPLIGAFEKNKNGEVIDFKGHEVEYKIVKKDGAIDIETIYIEQPLGLIPETNSGHYEELDDKSWFVVDGYIWKEYCREAYNLIEESESKTVSMEIKILESHTDEDGEYWIDKYKYLGVTILGDSKTPAMSKEAIISLYELSDTEKFVSSFEVISDEINRYISNKKESEVEIMAKAKNEQFSMSVSQIQDFIQKELQKRTYIGKTYYNEAVERQEFYLQDVLTEENLVIVSDSKNWGVYFGIGYSFSGDLVTLDFEGMTRYVVGDWRAMVEGTVDNTVVTFEAIKTEYEKELETFEAKIVEKTNADFDVKETEAYKAIEIELSEVKEKFTVPVEGIEPIVEGEKDTFEAEKVEPVTEVEKATFEAKELELKEVTEKFEALTIENERLQKFETEKIAEQRVTDEKVLFEQYTELNEVEGFDILKDECSKYTIEELDTKLAVLFAKTYKSKGKFTVEDKKEGAVKVPIGILTDNEEKPYGGLFEKYSE
ncbi:hypothetical protein [Clostridium tagluense]|uniref:Uncharacterized protein n=1 Tax=Clostridium tagluense TaxID=360422 RepID=A0A401ULM6_9CLOT|nr:hypothetical protein [Clostridium tagluense]GCD10433.1 hypothetical protein Ctaglu_20560 [Clostridium tagluense]